MHHEVRRGQSPPWRKKEVNMWSTPKNFPEIYILEMFIYQLSTLLTTNLEITTFSSLPLFSDSGTPIPISTFAFPLMLSSCVWPRNTIMKRENDISPRVMISHLAWWYLTWIRTSLAPSSARYSCLIFSSVSDNFTYFTPSFCSNIQKALPAYIV